MGGDLCDVQRSITVYMDSFKQPVMTCQLRYVSQLEVGCDATFEATKMSTLGLGLGSLLLEG